MKYVLLFWLCILSSVFAADMPVEFDNEQKQARYHALLEEIRCLVCQNQSLADSSAGLAQDLRNEIYDMVQQDQSEQAIMQFLVDRYGDFVLYRPRLQSNTWLLWTGPFIALIIAVVIVFVIIKRQSKALSQRLELSPEQKQKLEQLIDNNEKS